MRDKLLKIFPEIEEIEDKDIRENTIKCWLLAMERAGWTFEDLEEMPFSLLLKDTKHDINYIEKTQCFVKNCFSIYEHMNEIYGEKLKINKDILIAGAVLCDIGKLLEYERIDDEFVTTHEGKVLRHPLSGAILASECGLPIEIVHIIAYHSKEGDGIKRTVEGIIVHHCDFINFDPFYKGLEL
jgi:putative nucleotidyltransferase with HDIG domain